ncbi:tail fiber domain-containing protein [bacterium]|nr:tail fiber domain-containing protein [bacterium]
MFKLLLKLKNKNKKAFTIAEMTVVLLILSIVMAAILPVTTNKKTSGSGGGSSGGGSLWKLARNNTDIWFASPSSTQSVLTGTSQTPDSNGNGRIYINIPESTSRSQIAMMYNNSTVGYIKFKSGHNMGFGPNPFPSAVTGSNNISMGENSLISLTSGSSNVGLGNGALRSVNTGGINIAIGPQTLGKTTTANHNIGIGSNALYNNTTGLDNIAVGEIALTTNSTGNYNVGLGRYALANSTSTDNTATGHQALYNNSSGAGNTAFGAYAGLSNTTGSNNTSIGYQAYYANAKTGNQNIALGYQALYSGNGAGSNNVGIGSETLRILTSGSYNNIVGQRAGYSLTTGTGNTSLGTYSLYSNAGGSYNTGIGYNACGVITGGYKSCFGYNSGNTTIPNGFTTNNNTVETIVGSGAGNIFLHAGSVYVETGADNKDSGTGASFRTAGNITANSNITAGTYLTTGSYAVIGTYANVGTNLAVGTHTYTNYLYTNEIRNRTSPGSTNTIIYGTLYGQMHIISDKRLKNIEGFANTGLAEVKKLDIYKYTYKNDPETQKIGLIAQDVEKVIPFAVKKGNDGYLSISQENIIYTMFNAIKDLDKLYESLKSKFQDYIVRLNLAEDRINALIEVNRDLSKRIDDLEKRVNTLEKECKCKCKQ